jgi:hypothetical protein
MMQVGWPQLVKAFVLAALLASITDWYFFGRPGLRSAQQVGVAADFRGRSLGRGFLVVQPRCPKQSPDSDSEGNDQECVEHQ